MLDCDNFFFFFFRSPVVEPEVRGVERFLPGQPADLIRQGKFHQVPLLVGLTEDEFGGVVVSKKNNHFNFYMFHLFIFVSI